jgi:hypothetical protein
MRKFFKIKKRNKAKFLIILVIISALILISLLLIFEHIIIPSHKSVVNSCDFAKANNVTSIDMYQYEFTNFTTEQEEKILQQYIDFKIENNHTTIAFFDSVTRKIVYLEENPDERTIKHEECHKKQYEERRIVNCESYIKKFLIEVECNLAEFR